jgi:hypothetical protein
MSCRQNNADTIETSKIEEKFPKTRKNQEIMLVIAPVSAPCTNLAYLANTPLV